MYMLNSLMVLSSSSLQQVNSVCEKGFKCFLKKKKKLSTKPNFIGGRFLFGGSTKYVGYNVKDCEVGSEAQSLCQTVASTPPTQCDRSSVRPSTQPQASLSLGGSGDGGSLHRNGSRGGLMVGVGSDLEPARPGGHQANGVAGEQRQILGVQEERRGYQVGRVSS